MLDYIGTYFDRFILSLPENKCNDFSSIRKEFYNLHFEELPLLVDLGNLQLMPTKQESFKQIEKVCSILLQNNIIPFVIGGKEKQLISFLLQTEYIKLN